MAGMSEPTYTALAESGPTNGAPTPIEQACRALDQTIDNLDKVASVLEERLGFCLATEVDDVQSMTILRDGDRQRGSSNLTMRLVEFDRRVDAIRTMLGRLTSRVEL